MGLYSLYNNATINCQLEWSIQSPLTHFLAEEFESIRDDSNQNFTNNHFNNLCYTFRNKLTFINPTKFPDLEHI